LYSNNITVIDGATNQVTTIADPNAIQPYAIAVDSMTNQVYVANLGSNNLTVIDGATNQVSTITDPNAHSPVAIAVNWISNEIYVANSNNVTVIDGLTKTAKTLSPPNALGAASIAIDVASNKVFVANSGSDNITVIDGVTKGMTITQDRNAITPSFVAVNPVTQKVYATNSGYSSSNISVVTEEKAASIPLQVTIQPLPKNETKNPTPTFTFTAKDAFVPNPTVIDGVWYQVDTWQGKWLAAKSTGTSTYKGKVTSPLTLGMHVLYAYATDGQEATNTNTGPGTSPLVGKIAAYPFLVY
jgi:YVTN family beta-propeller protein